MSNSNNIDRQLEVALESFFKFLFRTISKILRGILRGIKKLTRLPTWFGLLIAMMVTCSGIYFKDQIKAIEAPIYIRGLIYTILLCSPIIYLYVLGGWGSKSEEMYTKIFKDIGFAGKDGKYPMFCGSNKDGKKQILIFKSNIPLKDWKAAKARLETSLDCNILKMESGSSKKIVKLTMLPADFRIPENIAWNDSICDTHNGVITIGQSALGNISFNLNRVPHVLVAGETGSGKSVILRCILWQMILQGSRVFMIDFKGGVEFGKQYERFGEVIVDRGRALEVLDMLVRENEYRLSLFRDMEVKNLAEYNRKTNQNLCRIGLFSDEIAEMLDKKGVSKEQKAIYEALEGKLSTLARLSRATGINLFLGVQRPDANVLTGQIKNNVPVRISGRFADKTASEIVLGNTDAVDLPDIKGRFLYKVGNETIEFQAFYFDDEQMLHDVSVETGTMLTEPETYDSKRSKKAEKKEYKEIQESIKDKEKKNNKKKLKQVKENKGTEMFNISDDYDAYPDWSMDEELPFPLDNDYSDNDIFENLNLNFQEDDG